MFPTLLLRNGFLTFVGTISILKSQASLSIVFSLLLWGHLLNLNLEDPSIAWSNINRFGIHFDICLCFCFLFPNMKHI